MRMKLCVYLLVSAGILALCIIGCYPGPGKYTGGGWLPSTAGGNAKATFGFNMNAIDEDGDAYPEVVRGQIQYNDNVAGVQIHGEVTSGGDWWGDFGQLNGTFDDGRFRVGVWDRGEPGPSEADSIVVEVYFDNGDFYSNNGRIQGGNIQQHKSK